MKSDFSLYQKQTHFQKYLSLEDFRGLNWKHDKLDRLHLVYDISSLYGVVTYEKLEFIIRTTNVFFYLP